MIFCCPICSASLMRNEKNYICQNGHSYDIAKEGYVHLLPSNHMRSKSPGDDKEMVNARNRFLSEGYYSDLRNELCGLAIKYTSDNPIILDSGCGEGYYTCGLFESLTIANKKPIIAGIDISKPSLKYAARRVKSAEFAIASVYHLPVETGIIDLLINCFSPLALDEFRRVLKPGGRFLYVVPAADHLLELKKILYTNPYLNQEENSTYEDFTCDQIYPIKKTMTLTNTALTDLFRMTPYYWKTPKAGSERLSILSELEVTASFNIHVFTKKAGL